MYDMRQGSELRVEWDREGDDSSGPILSGLCGREEKLVLCDVGNGLERGCDKMVWVATRQEHYSQSLQSLKEIFFISDDSAVPEGLTENSAPFAGKGMVGGMV